MITLQVPNISCGHCARSVTEAIHELDPAATVSVDVPAKRVSFDTSAPLDQVFAKLAGAGYPASAL